MPVLPSLWFIPVVVIFLMYLPLIFVILKFVLLSSIGVSVLFFFVWPMSIWYTAYLRIRYPSMDAEEIEAVVVDEMGINERED